LASQRTNAKNEHAILKRELVHVHHGPEKVRSFIASFPQSVPVKEFFNWSIFGENIDKSLLGATFFVAHGVKSPFINFRSEFLSLLPRRVLDDENSRVGLRLVKSQHTTLYRIDSR